MLPASRQQQQKQQQQQQHCSSSRPPPRRPRKSPRPAGAEAPVRARALRRKAQTRRGRGRGCFRRSKTATKKGRNLHRRPRLLCGPSRPFSCGFSKASRNRVLLATTIQRRGSGEGLPFGPEREKRPLWKKQKPVARKQRRRRKRAREAAAARLLSSSSWP